MGRVGLPTTNNSDTTVLVDSFLTPLLDGILCHVFILIENIGGYRYLTDNDATQIRNLNPQPPLFNDETLFK